MLGWFVPCQLKHQVGLGWFYEAEPRQQQMLFPGPLALCYQETWPGKQNVSSLKPICFCRDIPYPVFCLWCQWGGFGEQRGTDLLLLLKRAAREKHGALILSMVAAPR